MTQIPDEFPHSLREINDLPEEQKLAIYYSLVPDWVCRRFSINVETRTIHGKPVVDVCAVPGSRSVEMSIYHKPDALEPAIYLHMADTFLNQLMVLLVVMNDPDSPRYYIDVMPDGRQTYYGTSMRNIEEEIRAMEAGLAPGQIHSGLRGFRRTVPDFEDFVRRMGHDLFLIEPLSYHNAIVFERYGFGYTYGKKEMERIHQQFQPGSDYYFLLDNSTPFRKPEAWNSIRGRSWAIHDGIMGIPFTGFHMYKRIGHEAGVNTFPDAKW